MMSRRPLSGIVALGDSNTHMSYMIAATGGSAWGGTGAVEQPSKRWTEKLAIATGQRVYNYGQNGRKTNDLYAPDTIDADSYHGLLQGSAQRGWINARAQIVVIATGINDDDVSVDAFATRYRKLIRIARASTAHVVCCTLPFVDFTGGHYSYDRNAVFAPQNVEIEQAAADLGAHVCDISAACEADIDIGNWNHRIRTDGTIGSSEANDLIHIAEWPTWFTDIHWDDAGAVLVANELAITIAAI